MIATAAWLLTKALSAIAFLLGARLEPAQNETGSWVGVRFVWPSGRRWVIMVQIREDA